MQRRKSGGREFKIEAVRMVRERWQKCCPGVSTSTSTRTFFANG